MRYYSKMRPVGMGTYPKRGATAIVNFDACEYVPEIEHNAWGYIDYDRELSPDEVEAYELAVAPSA